MNFILKTEEIENSQNIIFDSLINNKSLDLNTFSNKLDKCFSQIIEKLISGDLCSEDSINDFVGLLPDKKAYNEIVKLRWSAINNIYKQQYDIALENLEEAKKLSTKKRLEKWIIRDIVCDLRKIEILKDSPLIKFNSKYQKTLDKLSNNYIQPYIDRYSNNAFEILEKETFKLNTKSANETFFGGNLQSCLRELSESFIYAIYYGSFTFITILMNRIAFTLYHYSKIYNDSNIFSHSLRLFTINSNHDVLEKLINTEWNFIYKEFISTPMDLINLTSNSHDYLQNEKTKCLLIEKLGPYLPSESLSEIQAFIFKCLDDNFSKSKIIDIKTSALKSLQQIVNRLEINIILMKLIDNLDKHFLLTDEILNILNVLDWKKIDDKEKVKEIIQKLFVNKNNLLRSSKMYSLFYEIEKYYPNLLQEENNELCKELESSKNMDIIAYFSYNNQNLAKEITNNIIIFLLELIGDNNSSAKIGSITGGGYSFFEILIHYFKKKEFEITNEMLELFKDILLNKQQSIQIKYECLNFIINIVNQNNLDKFKILYNEITKNKENLLETSKIFLFNYYQTENIQLKLFELKLKLNEPYDLELILSKCIEYDLTSITKVQEDVLEVMNKLICLPETIANCTNYKFNVIQFLYSKTFDPSYNIKGNAIFYLIDACIEDKQWYNISINRLKDLIYDSNSYVRSSVVYAINKQLKDGKKKDEFEYILNIAQNDPHYLIRKQADETLKLFEN